MDSKIPRGPALRLNFGVPIYLHWTLPALGGVLGLLPSMANTEFSILGYVYITVWLLLLFAAHELGHAIVAWRYQSQVLGIFLSVQGGRCFVFPLPPTRTARALFYLGGVLAQLIVLWATVVALFIFGAPNALWATCAVYVFIGLNFIYMVFNLVPHRDNDGAKLLAAMR